MNWSLRLFGYAFLGFTWLKLSSMFHQLTVSILTHCITAPEMPYLFALFTTLTGMLIVISGSCYVTDSIEIAVLDLDRRDWCKGSHRLARAEHDVSGNLYSSASLNRYL